MSKLIERNACNQKEDLFNVVLKILLFHLIRHDMIYYITKCLYNFKKYFICYFNSYCGIMRFNVLSASVCFFLLHQYCQAQ